MAKMGNRKLQTHMKYSRQKKNRRKKEGDLIYIHSRLIKFGTFSRRNGISMWTISIEWRQICENESMKWRQNYFYVVNVTNELFL